MLLLSCGSHNHSGRRSGPEEQSTPGAQTSPSPTHVGVVERSWTLCQLPYNPSSGVPHPIPLWVPPPNSYLLEGGPIVENGLRVIALKNQIVLSSMIPRYYVLSKALFMLFDTHASRPEQQKSFA